MTEVEIDMSNLRPRAGKSLGPVVERILNDYFNSHGDEHGVIFKALDVGAGVSRETMVAHKPALKRPPKVTGVPVGVWVKGTQAVFGLLNPLADSGTSLERIEAVVKAGFKRPDPKPRTERRAHEDDIETERRQGADRRQGECSPDLSDESKGEKPEGEIMSGMKLLKIGENEYWVPDVMETREIDAELVASGLPEHDINYLRIFFLELVQENFGGSKNGYVFVANSVISSKAETLLEIDTHTPGSAGTFYAARIRPFGERCEEKGVKGWSLDVAKVVAFVGEATQIPKMKCPRSGVCGDEKADDLDVGENGDGKKSSVSSEASLAETVVGQGLGDLLKALREAAENKERLTQEIATLDEALLSFQGKIGAVKAEIERLSAELAVLFAESDSTEAELTVKRAELQDCVPEGLLKQADEIHKLAAKLVD